MASAAAAAPPARKDDPTPTTTTNKKDTLTIVTWNVNSLISGLGANLKHQKKTLGAWLRSRLDADVVAMQETKLAAKRIPRELAVTDGYESFWATSLDKTGYSGVVTYAASPLWSPVDARAPALLFSSPPSAAAAAAAAAASSSPPSDPLDREGRVVETDFGSFVLINVYAPNAGHGSRRHPVEGGAGAAAAADGAGDDDDDADDDKTAAAAAGGGPSSNGASTGGAPTLSRRAVKLRFLRRLTERAKELHSEKRSVVLVGDLNVAVSDADVSPLIGSIADVYSAEERAAFQELLAELPDVWRALHPVAAADRGGGGGGGGAEAGEAGGGGGGGAPNKKPPIAPSSSSAAPAPAPTKRSNFTVWDERTRAREEDRGLRIDYVLVSPWLLPLVASAEILTRDVIPPSWSDHAAVKVVFKLPGSQQPQQEGAAAAASSPPPQPVAVLAPPPPHAPCRASSLLDEQWALRPKGQKSISSFFSAAPKRPKAGEQAAAGAGGGGGGAGGGSNSEPATKKAK